MDNIKTKIANMPERKLKMYFYIIISVELIVIIAVACHIRYKVNMRAHKYEAAVAAAAQEEVSTKQMDSIYTTLLQGSWKSKESGEKFVFNTDGTFKGYFNKEAPEVNGTYSISDSTLVIYYNDQLSISYEISFDEDYNFVITSENNTFTLVSL